MTNYSEAKGRRIVNINMRFEATQSINPITGQPYLEYMSPKVKTLEDPLQAHLRAMEERNPSTNKHRQGPLKNIADRLSLIDRALQYKKGLISIYYKVSGVKRTPYEVSGVKRTPYDLLDEYRIYDRIIRRNLEDIIKKDCINFDIEYITQTKPPFPLLAPYKQQK